MDETLHQVLDRLVDVNLTLELRDHVLNNETRLGSAWLSMLRKGLLDSPARQKGETSTIEILVEGTWNVLFVQAEGGWPARAPTPRHYRPLFEKLQRVDAGKVEEAILAIREQVRGPVPKEQLIVLDGKEPRHGSGASVLTAVSIPSQHYLGSALVDQKTNEIPVARELFNRLELEDRLVSLDALHTQDETARALVLEHGADYLLTVKGNQPTVREQIQTLVDAPRGDFPPS